MDMNQAQQRSNSFVLRIWWEQRPTGTFWRGWVQHAASGESSYFAQLGDLLAFVEARTGPLRPSSNENTQLARKTQ